MMNLTMPLSLTALVTAIQLVVFSSEFCCNTKPGDGEGQETCAVFVAVSWMGNGGAPGVGTVTSDQNPPTSENWPPIMACALASGWPMVPLTENTPPVLVPP